MQTVSDDESAEDFEDSSPAFPNRATPKTWGDSFKFRGFEMSRCTVTAESCSYRKAQLNCSHAMQATIIQMSFRQRHLRWMFRVLEEFEGVPVYLEKIKPDVKQTIAWT